MQCPRPAVFVLLATACGPLVPVDEVDEGEDTGASTGTRDPDDGPNGDTGEGGNVPPSGEVGEDEGGDELDSGSGAICGDGIVDAGEICDDGNDASGDGCEADCTSTPGVLLWSQSVDGDGSNDSARAVAVDPYGHLLVAGAVRIGGDDAVWLGEFLPDGLSVAEHVVLFNNDAYATAIAVTPEDNVFVAGLEPATDRAVLLQLSGLDLVELVEIDGAPTDILSFTALASPTSEGFVVVTNAGGFDDVTATVRRYDSAGSIIGDVVQPQDIFVGAAVPSVDGGTILGGGAFVEMGSSVWLSALASDGSTLWSAPGPVEAEMSVRLRGLATAPDGRIVAVGTRGYGGPGGDDVGWIWWWSAAGVPEGDGPLDIGGAAARANAVVVGAHGIVVGGTAVDNEDGFVAGFAEDGSLTWGFELAGDLGLEDGIAALTLAPGLGVVAVGWLTQSNTNQDAWIGVFTD